MSGDFNPEGWIFNDALGWMRRDPLPEPTYGQLALQLAQLQTRLALLEQRSARQDAQIAELTARLDESEGGK